MNFETAFREYFEGNNFIQKCSHRIWPLNIIFVAPDKTTDETQFDLHPEDVRLEQLYLQRFGTMLA